MEAWRALWLGQEGRGTRAEEGRANLGAVGVGVEEAGAKEPEGHFPDSGVTGGPEGGSGWVHS